MMRNWEDYRFILAVMEEGSLSAAARRLGVNHATVLRRVNAFEQRLGVRIFERAPGGYRMAADRLAVREALRQMAEAAARAERAMQGQGAGVEGPLRITSTDSMCDRIMPRVLSGLHRRFPELKLELVVSNARLDLGRLEAEITVRPALELPQELVGDEVARMCIRPYAAPAYLASRRSGGVLRWLGASGALRNAPSSRWIEENVPEERIAQRADSFITLRALAREGQGIAYLPAMLVNRTDSLVPCTELGPSIHTRLWVAHHRDLEGVERIRACRAHLAEALAAFRGELEGEVIPD